MSAPSLPTGYDVSKHVPAGRRDCLLTVGDSRLRSLPVSHDALTAVGLSKQDSGSRTADAAAADMSVHRESTAIDLQYITKPVS